jgi:hypothetical protein
MHMPHRLRRWAPAAVVALFVFRLLFGLSSEFFFEDETQIFLMGFRYYATGHWPYFGPDVVWTKSEIPGALQAILIGVPLKILPVPEAPFVLLNLLSTGALAGFAVFLARRFPAMPRWLIWGWLLTIPWTLQYSTHVINPSYVLPAAVVFFIGFFEAVPGFRIGTIGPPIAFGMMGAAVTWVMQIHMSWPLLLPYVAYACFATRAEGVRALAVRVLAFFGGALLPGILLIPTWVQFGLRAGSGGTLNNIHFHVVNPWMMVTTLARFLSFPSLEINRFIATDGAKRLVFFERHPWLVPLTAIAWAAGVVQPIWMLYEGIRRNGGPPMWQALRRLMAASIVLVYASYWFVMEPPQAHAFYVLAPIALVFAAYCWSFVDSPRMRRAAAAVLAVNIAYHAGLAVAQAPEKSLYKNRVPVAAAVRLKQPEMFAHRRPFAIDGGPASLVDPSRKYDPPHDLTVLDAAHRVGIGHYLQWTVTLRNDNPRVAFRDLLYYTTYRDAGGRVIDERHEVIKELLEPGEMRYFDVNDGWVPPGFTSATFRIVAAEALRPYEPPASARR